MASLRNLLHSGVMGGELARRFYRRAVPTVALQWMLLASARLVASTAPVVLLRGANEKSTTREAVELTARAFPAELTRLLATVRSLTRHGGGWSTPLKLTGSPRSSLEHL
jgi:hypothetical protein